MGIEIENIQNKIEVTDRMHELINKALVVCLELENFTRTCEIYVMLVDNEEIKRINYEHRNIDKPTDVLSFPIVEMTDGIINTDSGDFNIDEGSMVLGDIVISLEMARQQSLDYGHSFERELVFLLTHGFFHLLGYDHDIAKRESIMLEKQYQALKTLNLER
ncbi:MAG: rRNA maturation RNase YbeY [Clostridiaceae bacterium]|nr:rRNA maturation RNase YbeY [Clostridiaceae bacterium]